MILFDWIRAHSFTVVNSVVSAVNLSFAVFLLAVGNPNWVVNAFASVFCGGCAYLVYIVENKSTLRKEEINKRDKGVVGAQK
jgi:hypothetical protein